MLPSFLICPILSISVEICVFGAFSDLLDIRERAIFFAKMVLQSHLNLENCMTVRTGYVLWRSAASSAPRRTKRRERTSGQERRSERAAKSKVKIKASENGEIVFRPVRLSARNRALSGSERCLLSGLTFRRFTQGHIKRQKRKVPPVTNVSSAVFPAESRVSKTSALWRTGATI